METIENRFKMGRKIKGESVQTVSENTGITRSLIDALETDKGKEKGRGVSYQTIKELAEYYDVSMDYLCGLTDTPNISNGTQSVYDLLGLNESTINMLICINKKGGKIKTLCKNLVGNIVFQIYNNA